VQQYRHGGGLLIATRVSFDSVHVKYRITYDRLIHALIGLVRAQIRRVRTASLVRGASIDQLKRGKPLGLDDLRLLHFELEQRKSEVLGCSRFIAALSCVDGVVLLDKHLTVHGFGVELRNDNDLESVFMAGDAEAGPARLREVDLAQFGTRHRALMRYCHQNPGALAFAVSQDGDIQAMTRIDERLILWENIDVQLAFKADNGSLDDRVAPPLLRRIHARAEA
jgi:hypothetical protein